MAQKYRADFKCYPSGGIFHVYLAFSRVYHGLSAKMSTFAQAATQRSAQQNKNYDILFHLLLFSCANFYIQRVEKTG